MSAIDTMSGCQSLASGSAETKAPPTRRAGVLSAGWSWCMTRIDKRRSRNTLAELTDEQLRDIGLTRPQAIHEASRPFWR